MTKEKKVQTTPLFWWQKVSTVCRRDTGSTQCLKADCSTVADAQVDICRHEHSHRVSDVWQWTRWVLALCSHWFNTSREVCILRFDRRQQFFKRESKTRITMSYQLTDWHGTSWTLSTNERQASKVRLADGRREDSSDSCLAAGGSAQRSAGDRVTKCLARCRHFGSGADPPGIGREIRHR